MTKPRFATPEDVLAAVNQYIHKLNDEGGRFEFPIVLDKKPRKPNAFRLSNSGSCQRKMAYTKLYPDEQEEMSTRALSVFMLGDVIHEQERALIREVTELHSEESDVHFRIDDEVGVVVGHTDGIIELADGPIVLDVKTAATASFQRMAKEGAPEHYVAQLNAYMDGLGIHRAVLWVYDKNVSERMILPIAYDENLVRVVRNRFRAAWHATEDNLPEREYQPQDEMRQRKPTGRQYLPWQCSYCPFVAKCWGPEGFEMFIENGKPRWIREAPELTAEEKELLGV